MRTRRAVLVSVAVVVAILVVVAAVAVVLVRRQQPQAVRPVSAFDEILPAPASVQPAEGVTFTLPNHPRIVAVPDVLEAVQVGAYLADLLGTDPPATAVRSEVVTGDITLALDPTVTPDEAYVLSIDGSGVTIRAGTSAGLFRGVQTLRQLLPADPSSGGALPGGVIIDQPRFAYRGLMLDVARHFFDVAAVERVIDLVSMYKINYLHLHLTDDQGWRIAVDGWPRLAEYGGGSEVGGGPGGYYTRDDYRAIVAYAAARFVTIVPEVDLPGHTNAALAAYPELTCDGVAPPRYTGINVGFSALCPTSAATTRLLNDVFSQLAALTPGPYLHIGGDEAPTLSPADYAAIVSTALTAVARHGKTAMGWHDIAAAGPDPDTVLQYWSTAPYAAVSGPASARFGSGLSARGTSANKLVLSPADHAYVDQKYTPDDRLGLTWAGPTSVEKSYDWDPATLVPGVDESSVLGVEAALWTETVTTMDDLEYLLFPRLAAIAEIGWSPAATHDWAAFRVRLGAQAQRWTTLGIAAGPLP